MGWGWNYILLNRDYYIEEEEDQNTCPISYANTLDWDLIVKISVLR